MDASHAVSEAMQEPLSPPSPQGPPPMPQGPPVMPMIEEMRPTRITLYGVLHIVFASFGLLSAVSGITMIVLQLCGVNFMQSFYLGFGQMNGANAEQSEQYQQLLNLQRSLLPYQAFQTILNLVVSVLLLMAGIKLVKLRKNAIKWSNKVSMLKIAAIVLSGIITMKFSMPSMRLGMEQGYKTGSHSVSVSPIEKQAESWMFMTMVGTQIAMILALLLYPASALYFLNQPKSEGWLARYGKD
jgi:hypothetical protein